MKPLASTVSELDILEATFTKTKMERRSEGVKALSKFQIQYIVLSRWM